MPLKDNWEMFGIETEMVMQVQTLQAKVNQYVIELSQGGDDELDDRVYSMLKFADPWTIAAYEVARKHIGVMVKFDDQTEVNIDKQEEAMRDIVGASVIQIKEAIKKQ